MTKLMIFFAGALSGASVYALIAMTAVIQTAHHEKPTLSLQESVDYDCMVRHGIKGKCEAFMRIMARARASESKKDELPSRALSPKRCQRRG